MNNRYDEDFYDLDNYDDGKTGKNNNEYDDIYSSRSGEEQHAYQQSSFHGLSVLLQLNSYL